MFIRLLLAVWFLLTMLTACGNVPPTPNANAITPTPTPVDASTIAQPSLPPTIMGEITQINQRMLVEQHPGATIGDKVAFSLNAATRVVARTGDQLNPKTVGDLAVGQRVEVWDAGVVLQSFPAQADAATIVIADVAATRLPNAGAPPGREPDVTGMITQATNSVLVDQSFLLFTTPTTLFFRKSDEKIEPINARDITEGLQIEAWVDEISYDGSPPRGNAIAVVVIND